MTYIREVIENAAHYIAGLVYGLTIIHDQLVPLLMITIFVVYQVIDMILYKDCIDIELTQFLIGVIYGILIEVILLYVIGFGVGEYIVNLVYFIWSKLFA